MSIILDEGTTVVVQGTGMQGTFHAQRNQQYGTRILAGVHPQRGGMMWAELGLPIFSTVADAVRETGANTSLIMVPAPFTRLAILDAYEAGIATIVVITEGMPVHDMTEVYDTVVRKGRVRLIGPNCPGAISPGKSNVGIIPANIAGPGNIGLVSRSGTLTYQIMHELAAGGLGISTCVGIGGDPVVGSTFLDIIKLFVDDPQTEGIVYVGEIGGREEQEAGSWLAENVPGFPVLAYIAGFEAPVGKQMGHAGAIVRAGGPGGETAAEKKEILEGLGNAVAMNPSQAAQLIIERHT